MRRGGANAFADTAGDAGCAELLRHFIAGVIAHTPGLMAFLNPTVNSYRRIDPHELVPTRACWGYDNRFGLVRVPPERGGATRVEMRLADGSANVYLATAALLFAGLDGVKRELTPPAAVKASSTSCPRKTRESRFRSRWTRRSMPWRPTRRCATRWAPRSSRRS